jgi:hypothetical protein
VLFYRAAVDSSRPTLHYVACLIRRTHQALGSARRLLNPGQQALLVLVHLRKGETFTELAAGFQVSTATGWRYVQAVAALLSVRSPKLAAALRKARKGGLHLLVLYGTLIACRPGGRRPAVPLGQTPLPRDVYPGHLRS